MALGRLAAGLVLVLVAACSPAATPRPATPDAVMPGFAVDLGLGEPLDPTLGNPGYDVGHYQLDLTYDPYRVWLDATVTLTATATASLSSVNVDFIGFDVQAVTVDGEAAAFARTERDMTIRPRTALAAGEQFELSVRYQGKPRPFKSDAGVQGRLGWNVSDSGTSYVVSEPDGARSWFPCNDVPSDKATYTFRLVVPGGLVAAANGTLEGKFALGSQTVWVWQMAEPMATYLATVIIGDYQIVDDPAASAVAGVPIRNLLPRAHGYDADIALGGQMIAFLAQYLGPFPFRTYGVADVPGAIGALECQTLTVAGAYADNTLAHELAHQWLGDDVSPASWHDIWLNEGFATYMEWLWEEHRGQWTVAEHAAYEYRQERGLPPPGNPPAGYLFTRSVYGRGALTLYALRARIGDAAFLATLRAWVDAFGGRSATTEDFIALAERVSGTDLTEFFQGWLYAATMPELPALPSARGPSWSDGGAAG